MIKKTLGLVAILGSLAGGCQTYEKPTLQAECKMGDLDVKVYHIENTSFFNTDSGLRTIKMFKDDGELFSLYRVNKTHPFWIICDDGSSITVPNGTLHHSSEKDKIEYQK